MIIKLLRLYSSTKGTFSAVYIDGRPLIINNIPIFAMEPRDWFAEAHTKPTLEDYANAKKAAKEEGWHAICIPKGSYNISISYSPKFKRKLPLLENVPCFEGIRIHSFNFIDETKGCISFGHMDKNYLLYTSPTCQKIQDRIQEALNRKEDVQITIDSLY